MGRPRTGAWSVYESIRIELPYLLKHGYIKKHCIVSSRLTWTDGRNPVSASVGFKSSYLAENENYIELTYTLTVGGGEPIACNYRVQLEEVPSNLGKGKVLYFSCHESYRRCRILYS